MLEKLIVFVEEYSMEAALEGLLPQILGSTDFQIIRFQCKDDLLKQLPIRLKGYGWLPENWLILVLVDRDNDDCLQLKKKMEEAAEGAGLLTKTGTGGIYPFRVINRIVIEELEAWYFGDWDAVKKAYPKVSKNIPNKSGYRDPDAIKGGTWEALERILKKCGYFSTGLRKAECAREIVPNMDIHRNTSVSFQAFRNAVESVVG